MLKINKEKETRSKHKHNFANTPTLQLVNLKLPTKKIYKVSKQIIKRRIKRIIMIKVRIMNDIK